MTKIELKYKNHNTALRIQVQSTYDNPSSIQKTIGNSQPTQQEKLYEKKFLDFKKCYSINIISKARESFQKHATRSEQWISPN